MRNKFTKTIGIVLVFTGLFAVCLGNVTLSYCNKKGEVTNRHFCKVHDLDNKAVKSCCAEKHEEPSMTCCVDFEFKHVALQYKIKIPDYGMEFLIVPQEGSKYFFIQTFTKKQPLLFSKKLHLTPISQNIYLQNCKFQC